MADAESHRPTETWTLVGIPNAADGGSHTVIRSGPDLEPGEVVRVARPERVCQELAEALRDRAALVVDATPLPARHYRAAAEFVERFGKAGGEDG